MRNNKHTDQPDEDNPDMEKSSDIGNDSSGVSSEETEFSSTSSEDESPQEPKPNFQDPGYESTEDEEEEKEDGDAPENLRIIHEGSKFGLPEIAQDEKPDWFDPEKYRIGQEFARKYYFCINFSGMVSLLYLFVFQDGFVPLMYTDKSATTFTSFKRYLSTVIRIRSWYESDLWDRNSPGYRNIRIVRNMHSSVERKLNLSTKREIMNRVDKLNNSKTLNCPLTEVIRQDVTESLCPFYNPPKKETLPKIFFNQRTMSYTQFGFIGLVVAYPREFGAASATRDELEGFVHVWRCIGYLLGIEDAYNFCNGTLEDVRERSVTIFEKEVKPKFFHVTKEWEHFGRCMVDGISFYIPGNIYEVVLLYLFWVLNIKAPRLTSRLTWTNYFRLQFYKFTMCVAMRVPWILKHVNGLLLIALRRADKFSREKLETLQKTSDGIGQINN